MKIDDQKESPYDFYPLLTPGERFPINDPFLEPRLGVSDDENGKSDDEKEVDFLHGILEGIAKIEKMGYDKLHELGCDKVEKIVTCGGGAQNVQWTNIRERLMKVPILKAESVDACVGAAKLARQGLQSSSNV